MKYGIKNTFGKIINSFSKEEYDRYNFSKRGKIIVYIITAIIWFLMIRNCYIDHSILNSKCKTIGKIISASEHSIEYEYFVDGRGYHFKISTKGISTKIEINNYDKFWVYYDCNDPNSSIMNFDERYTDTIPPADETK